MQDNQESFSEFITDHDGEYSKSKFLSVANALIEEGRRPERVFRAMLLAAYRASFEHSTDEHYSFVRWAHEEINDYKPKLEVELDAMIAHAKNAKS